MKGMSNLKIQVSAIVGVVLFAIVGFMSSEIVETNYNGYYQIKQAAVTGSMSVINEPGLYMQNFGDIHTYQISDMVYFSKRSEEGGDGITAEPIQVRYNDGAQAIISGSVKFKLSQKEENELELHKDFKSYESVRSDLVRQVMVEALMQTATLMKAEECYSTRRAEFTALSEAQIKNGIYETISIEKEFTDAQGQKFIKREVIVKLDKDGHPIVRKISPFARYGITILQFVVKEIDYEKTIDELISKKKKAEQQKVVAKANAEKAKQDAITALEQGKADIAKAKATEEVEKIKAVTQANKEKEVAELKAEKEFNIAKFEAKQAKEVAKKIREEGKAQADADRFKVIAGLSPQEAAEWKYKTAVGVAEKLAGVNVPSIVIGGGKGGAGANPLEMIGVNMLLDIKKKLEN